MEKTPRKSTRAKWLLLNQDYESLDLTMREFCAERKVNIYTFKDWQKKFRKESAGASKGASSVELFRELPPTSGQGSYSMTLRGGRTLTVESGFMESELRKLIGILESC